MGSRGPRGRATSPAGAGEGGLPVHLALGKRRELLVRRLLLLQRLLQGLNDLLTAELLRERDQGPVARHLVVLDRLRGGQHRGIAHFRVVAIAHDLLGFLEDAVHCGALHRLGVLAELLEHLLQPLHLALRFREVLLERGLELRILRLLRHCRQIFHDLVFGVVDVLQGVDEQVIKRLDRLGKQSHRLFLHSCR